MLDFTRTSCRYLAICCVLVAVTLISMLSVPDGALGAQKTPTPPVLAETFVNLDVTLNYPTGWSLIELAPHYLTIATSEDLIFNMPRGDEPDTVNYAVGTVLIQLLVSAPGETVPEHPFDVLYLINENDTVLTGTFLGEPGLETINGIKVAKANVASKGVDAESNLYAFSRDGRYVMMRVTTATADYAQRAVYEAILTSIRFNTVEDLGNRGAASFTPAPSNANTATTPTPLAATRTPSATRATASISEATATRAITTAGLVLRQWASDASATSQYGDPSWNASQATGEPNTDTCGDNVTAWASRSGTGIESLTLYFDQPVTPTQINIYQTYNPGAITSVELLPVDGSTAIELADSADSGTDCPGVFTLDLNLDDIKPINGIKINLDESITGSWNEIDAVELVGTTRDNVALEPSSTPAPTATPDPKALRQWASDASASSQYGDSNWSAAQATGKPDTDTCGDNVTAWASSSSSGKDNLTLYYDKPVFPTQVNIYQTYNPGAIISVELLPADGSPAIKVPNSADPGTDCPGVFSVSITLDDIKPINGVRLYLDQTITNGWNEIDAVELVGRPSR